MMTMTITFRQPYRSPHVRESKTNTVLDSGFQATNSEFQILVSSFCHFYCWSDPGFLEVYFRFQRLGFQFLQVKFPVFRIPLHGATYIRTGMRASQSVSIVHRIKKSLKLCS